MRPSVRRKAYPSDSIEAESFGRIAGMRYWGDYPAEQVPILQRMVHAVGDPSIIENVVFSPNAVRKGVDVLRSGCPLITDVTMVKAGLNRRLVESLGIRVECFVHTEEAARRAEHLATTRSRAGIQIAAERFPSDALVAIGDAPTALSEVIRLIEGGSFLPSLVVGFPVGFVGTEEAKERLLGVATCEWITNRGTRGGSPLAASVLNALMIRAVKERTHGV